MSGSEFLSPALRSKADAHQAEDTAAIQSRVRTVAWKSLPDVKDGLHKDKLGESGPGRPALGLAVGWELSSSSREYSFEPKRFLLLKP